MKYLFTCGGTAGHINPALGAAGILKEIDKNAEFLFIGAEGRMETDLVPREGYDIKTIDISGISRSLSIEGIKNNLEAVKKVLSATKKAKQIIDEFKPDVAVGTGGYVCYPVLKAAKSKGIPAICHESNAVPGLTTKMLANVCDVIMTGFQATASLYPKGTNVLFTGTPVREQFLSISKEEARQKLGISPERKLLVSVWGSLGSGYINSIFPQFLQLALKDNSFMTIHSAGKRGYPGLKTAVKQDLMTKDPEKKKLVISEYIYDMPTVMAAADLIMCRSGASTLAELSVLGKPALLIPSPNVTNNHQEKNARLLEKAGAATVLTESECSPQLIYDTVSKLICNSSLLKEMGDNMRKTGNPDATKIIAQTALQWSQIKKH